MAAALPITFPMTPGLPSRRLNAAGVVSIMLALLALGIVVVRSIGWVLSAITALSIWQLAIVAGGLLVIASLVRLADRVRQHEGELAALRSQIATVRDQIETAKAPVISLDAARPRERARKAS